MPTLSEYNFQLVDLEVIRGKSKSILRIYIDKNGGITLDDLTQFNNRIGDTIDAEGIFEHSYILEVSSPGVNRRIRYPIDFDRFAGHQIKIKTYKKVDGSNNISGTLLGMEGDLVVVKKGDKKVLIELENIDHANLVYDWGKLEGGKKKHGK
ncbi:MAG: ribosome maturation factor RimP [Deltaproteobacteria bacterium]|nr:ribosome maturation factor RimP [Deltaproteobacteria bacterium]